VVGIRTKHHAKKQEYRYYRSQEQAHGTSEHETHRRQSEEGIIALTVLERRADRK
jgi:hypothetical protein